MRAVIQRVTRRASRGRRPRDGRNRGRAGGADRGRPRGFTCEPPPRWLRRIVNLRIFNDEQGKMNRSLFDTGGAVLAVSQFTLYGDARGQRRPSFLGAAPPDQGKAGYEEFVRALQALERSRRNRRVSSTHVRRTRKRRPGHHPARFRQALSDSVGRLLSRRAALRFSSERTDERNSQDSRSNGPRILRRRMARPQPDERARRHFRRRRVETSDPRRAFDLGAGASHRRVEHHLAAPVGRRGCGNYDGARLAAGVGSQRDRLEARARKSRRKPRSLARLRQRN